MIEAVQHVTAPDDPLPLNQYTMHLRLIFGIVAHVLFPCLNSNSWCWLKEILDTTVLFIMNKTTIKVFRKDVV